MIQGEIRVFYYRIQELVNPTKLNLPILDTLQYTVTGRVFINQRFIKKLKLKQ